MDEDWDLHAVVRGFATVTNNPISAAATDNPFPVSNSLPFLNSENSFDIPGLFDDKNDPFLGLHEIYQELCVESHPPPPPPATILGATATSPVTHALQPHDQIVQIQPLHVQMNTQQLRNTSFPSPLSFPSNSQPIRQRRRKNQQTKMIREMTQEELAADAWAWRKYGQKPIKGSPYPRNYYRCSTSKGCAARKQVERSLNDPAVFVVSYTGEHTHPRPIHRSSLAGSTRNRLAPTSLQIKNNNNIDGTNKNNKNALSLPMGSLSSPGSGSSFSSSTPTNEGEPVEQNEDVEMVEEAGEEDNDGGNEADDIDDNIMMINDLMMNDEDDIFKGFQESDQSSGGDLFSSGMLMSPPWTPIAAAAFDDEGCD